MRIGFFADMYLPHVSGITSQLSTYKRHFEARGHEVFVFAFGDRDYGDAEPGIVRSPGLPWGRTGWRLALGFSASARRLAETLDIAHVHHPFESGPLIASIAHRCRIPLVFTSHTRYDLYSDVYARFVPPAVRYAYVRRSLRALARRSQLVVAPSKSIARWLGEFAGIPNTEVVPNGINIHDFARPTHPVPRQELGFTDDDFVFCHTGRLGSEKSIVHLVEQFALTLAMVPNVRLLVVGDGPERSAAESVLASAAASRYVRFVGRVPHELVPNYEVAADAFVTASVSEVHPLVLLEAMAVGLPIVAIETPALSDVVGQRSGLLAPLDSASGLSKSMVRLAKDPELRSRLAAGARQAAGAYSLENTADRLLRRYAELQAPRPA